MGVEWRSVGECLSNVRECWGVWDGVGVCGGVCGSVGSIRDSEIVWGNVGVQ